MHVTWVTGVCIAYMFKRNSEGKTSKIEWLFESNLRYFGYFEGPTVLWLLLDPSCKGNLLARVDWALQTQIVNCCPKYGICKKQKLHSNSRYDPANFRFLSRHTKTSIKMFNEICCYMSEIYSLRNNCYIFIFNWFALWRNRSDTVYIYFKETLFFMKIV